MMYKCVFAVFIFTIFTTACAVRGPGVRVHVPGVEVGVVSGDTHCPPGQAKKGRC